LDSFSSAARIKRSTTQIEKGKKKETVDGSLSRTTLLNFGRDSSFLPLSKHSIKQIELVISDAKKK